MQILIQFYTIIVILCLLLLTSVKQIARSRFLTLLVVLLIYSVVVGIAMEIGREKVAMFFVLSGFIATTLFVPTAYLFLRNHFYKRHLLIKDLFHILPCLLFCAACAVAFLTNGNLSFLLYNTTQGSLDSGGVLFFQVFISLVIGSYLWMVSKMLKTNYMQFAKKISDSEFNPAFSENGNPEKKNGIHPLFFSDEKMSHIDSMVRQFLTENKPFLQHGYSLRHLSEDIHLPLHHLSAFINRYYQMNFNDFINEYRVHFCKVKIMNDEWKIKKLEAIAEESGFNNRNTFTSAFKKVTGQNPSEYLKGIKESQKLLEPLFHNDAQLIPQLTPELKTAS